MKKYPVITTYLLILGALSVLLISSCVSQKKIKYLQHQQEQDTTSFHAKRGNEYKIQPMDNLYIRIFSLDEKTYLFFNKTSLTSNSYNDYANDASIYLNSYSVTTEGYIDFPIAGKIYVKDLTVEEAKTKIQKLVDEYLKETLVVVKMVNFNITVVGEVYRPGKFRVYQDEMNIFEAVSLAGDMRDFADRNHVTLIRQTKGGSKVYTINLTSDQILNSELYYIKPNDVIYIPPLKIKQYGFEAFPYTTIFMALTALSSLLLVIYTIK
jgi:polysaccharide biosynthesis/export protein